MISAYFKLFPFIAELNTTKSKLNSPAALHGGTGGLLIQLLLQASLEGLDSQLNTRPPHFLNTQPGSHTHPPHLEVGKKDSTLSCVSHLLSSWGATCEKYFSWEIHFYNRVGLEGRSCCKDTIKGAMGGTVGWCDRVEREMARRGIKGSENVSNRRRQREGGLEGEKEGRGGGGWTSGVWLAGEMFGRCKEVRKRAAHTQTHALIMSSLTVWGFHDRGHIFHIPAFEFRCCTLSIIVENVADILLSGQQGIFQNKTALWEIPSENTVLVFFYQPCTKIYLRHICLDEVAIFKIMLFSPPKTF